MPSLDDRLNLFRGCGPVSVADNLIAALARAEADERLPICAALVATGRPRAIAVVVEHLDRLGPAGLRLLTEPTTNLDAGLAWLATRSSASACRRALTVIERHGDPRLLRHLLPWLSAEDDQLADETAEVLLAVTIRTVGPTSRRTVSDAAFAALDRAVGSALDGFRRHRRRSVLLAAALMARRPGPVVDGILQEPDHPAAFALRGVVEHVDIEAVRLNLIEWLTVEPLHRQACRWMHRIDGVREWTDLLQSAHLLHVPARIAALRRVAHPVRCLPDLRTLRSLTPQRQAGLPALVRGLDLPAGAAVSHLSELATHGAPITRLKSGLILSSRREPLATAGLHRLCRDADPHVAQVAMLRSIDGRSSTDDVWRALERNLHPPIARRAAVRLAGLDVARFFERWLELSPGDRIAAAHAVTRKRPGAMAERLARVIVSGHREPVVTAILLCTRLGLGGPLVTALVVASRSDDPRIAATAVMALGAVPTSAAYDALCEAMRHPDPRTRANAVEALVKTRRPAAIRLVAPLVGSRNNRARANAVRGLLRAEPSAGVDALRAMLDDDDPLHCVSAIWVARGVDARPAASKLRRLARGRGPSEIRARARTALRRLEARGDQPVVTTNTSSNAGRWPVWPRRRKAVAP